MQISFRYLILICYLSSMHARTRMKHTSDTCFASLVTVAYRLNEPQYLCELRVVEQSHVSVVKGTNGRKKPNGQQDEIALDVVMEPHD
jgi:hypothetical protein